MLRTFRKGADGFLAKLLLVALILSFGLWGIGDIFRGAPENVIATVNDVPITEQELEAAIRAQQSEFEELTPEVAQSMPVRLQFLNRMINSRLLEEEAKALGIDFSEDALSARIANDPSFQGPDGTFDRNQFLAILQQNGISQGMFLQRYERDMQLGLLHGTIALTMKATPEMVEMYYHIFHEQREASLILLDESDIARIKAPDSETLQAMYDELQEQFRLPEYRTYRYVYFNNEKVAELLDLAPEEQAVREYYEQNLQDFQQPERIELLQLSFNSEQDAQQAREALTAEPSDTAVMEYAKDNDSVTNPDSVEIGAFSEEQLPTAQEDASAVFALKPGELSKPVETAFGWQLFFVKAKLEAGAQSFESVKAQIEPLLREQLLNDRLTELSNQLDDSVAGGATLEEALQAAGLPTLKVETLGPISATNMLKNGETYDMEPFEQEMLAAAFSQDIEEISPITISDDNQYFLVETLEVIPSMIPEFDTVKPKLEKQWMAQKRSEALRAKADALAAELQQAEHPFEAAKERGLSLHATGKLKRSDDTITNASQLKDKVLTAGFVDALFALQANEVSNPYPLPDGEFAIAIMESIHAAEPPTKTQLALLGENLNRQLSQQAVSAYLSALREKYPIEIFMDKIVAENDA